MTLGFWTVLGIVFGFGMVFLFGIYLGIRIAQYAVDQAITDAAIKGVLEYKNVRFIPVVKGGKP